jgi:hydroxypyruvate isomerase
MIRLSVCIEMIFKELPFLDRIDAVSRAGFDAFEFWGWRSKDVVGILKKKERNGLTVSAFGVDPVGRIVDPSTRSTFISGVKDSIKIAHKLDCSRIIVTTGAEIAGVGRDVQHKSIIESLKEATKLVEKTDITLVLEPLNILIDHKGYFLYSSQEGFEIVREVNSPNIKLLYDIYHQQITEGNLINTIMNNINSIGHFHSGDVPGRHEFGTGEINYYNVIRRIDELNYDGFIGLEFIPFKDSKDALQKVKEIAGCVS